MKKAVLCAVLLAAAFGLQAGGMRDLFVHKKDWQAKKIKGTHLKQTSFCVQNGVLCSTVRHNPYTAGELFDIAMRLTNEGVAQPAEWKKPLYEFTFLKGGAQKVDRTITCSRAQLYDAVIESLQKQESSASDYPVTTMLTSLRHFSTVVSTHPDKVAALAETLAVRRGVLRKDCLEVLVGLAAEPAPASQVTASKEAGDAATVAAPQMLENAGAQQSSAHTSENSGGIDSITLAQVAMILTGALSGILGADYLKRGKDSVLARAWAKGKSCAQNVVRCIFG